MDELVKASKASGRSLTQEIEDRLQRTLEEDRGKDEREIRLDNVAREVTELVRRNWEEWSATVAGRGSDRRPSRTETVADETQLMHRLADRMAGGQTCRAMQVEYGEPGEVARLVPVELEVTRGRDGNVVLVSRRGGLVIQETQTPVDVATALQLVGKVELAVSEPKPKRKSRRGA